MKRFLIFYFYLIFAHLTFAQNTFEYELELTPITISNLPGIHSYAVAQYNGKWLIIGGRKDGIHARQPFNAFSQSQNNTDIYVIDVNTLQFWTASLNLLSIGIKEQLQSTNMNFYQDNETLYIIGGYGYSATLGNHKTFNNLTAVDVPNLINAIVSGSSIISFFKQISNDIFANTGGQLGKIGNYFYLVGGQRFDGQYNPMNNPTFVQTYSNKIQKFTIDNSGLQLSYANYSALTDAVHLRRRDYNLLPQVFPNGELGYTISSGVFQINADLPFLYPVDIKSTGYFPQTQFNQYLSNYHSAKVGLYDLAENRMHNLFFGGISQYYYLNGNLIQDNNVPFVKTISRTTRFADGSLLEYKLPIEMPNLQGASAEFIPNHDLPHYENEVIKLNEITLDEFVIGYIYGGIQSPTLNPFSVNQSTTTAANSLIYKVKLIKIPTLELPSIDGKNPFSFSVSPNPVKNNIVRIQFDMPYQTSVSYIVSSLDGKILSEGDIEGTKAGQNSMDFTIENSNSEMVLITFIFDNKFYITQKVLRK